MATQNDPLNAARALRMTIRATRKETEEARRLALPTDFGGYEAEPVVALNVYEELAWADAARLWGGAVHTAKVAKTVVTSMYEAAGTSALYIDCPIERAHRDIHAVAQHTVLGHGRLEDAGRVHLGLNPSFRLF